MEVIKHVPLLVIFVRDESAQQCTSVWRVTGPYDVTPYVIVICVRIEECRYLFELLEKTLYHVKRMKVFTSE